MRTIFLADCFPKIPDFNIKKTLNSFTCYDDLLASGSIFDRITDVIIKYFSDDWIGFYR